MSYYNTLKSNAPGLTGGQTIAGQGYVGSFNGSTQYLNTATSTTLTLTGDFTIECWFYDTDIADTHSLFGKRPDSSTFGGIGLGHGSNENLLALVSGSGYTWDVIITSTIATPPNQWHHVAFTRSGNVYTLWVNGQSAGSQSQPAAPLANPSIPFTIGATAQDGSFPWSGYISNFRIVKGVAVYTGTFTVPTGPLTATASANPFGGANTSAITGTATSLLTLQNSTIIDNSTYPLSITNNGTVTTGLQTVPFGNTVYAGTVVYDGSTWQATPIQTTSLTVPVTGLRVTGGSTGNVLSTNGSGTLSWTSSSGGAAGPIGATGAGNTGATGVAGTNGATGLTGGTTLVFQNSGFNYSVDGFAGTFPALTLVRGQLYYFNLTNITSSHPLALRLTSANTSTVPGTTGNNTSSGVYGNGTTSTTVTYQVPFDAPSTIVYQCVNHSGMIGTINIVDQTGFTGATGTGTPGATGAQGIQGYIGATGPAGSGGSGSGGVGATGATGVGLTGATGPAGPAGSGSGSGGGVTISNNPPASPSVGSFWYVADFGVLSVYVQNGDGTYIWLDIGGKFIPDPEISELLLDGFALGAFADVTPLLLLSAKEGNNL